MTDREWLELAAKAAGIPRYRWDYEYCRSLGHMVTASMMWNPLVDDGEALRLAVKLQLDIAMEEDAQGFGFWCTVSKFDGPKLNEGISVSEMSPNDSCEAVRRAIVRAAAEIGRVMP